jgi:hypothetical protein
VNYEAKVGYRFVLIMCGHCNALVRLAMLESLDEAELLGCDEHVITASPPATVEAMAEAAGLGILVIEGVDLELPSAIGGHAA